MFIINFKDVSKGQVLQGGFTPIKILLTLAYLKFKGYKPFRYQGERTESKLRVGLSAKAMVASRVNL